MSEGSLLVSAKRIMDRMRYHHGERWQPYIAAGLRDPSAWALPTDHAWTVSSLFDLHRGDNVWSLYDTANCRWDEPGSAVWDQDVNAALNQHAGHAPERSSQREANRTIQRANGSSTISVQSQSFEASTTPAHCYLQCADAEDV